MKRPPISPRPRFVEDFLVVDGITRAGKFMLGNIVSAFARVDFLQHAHLLDTLPYLHHLGHVETEAAKALLRTEIDFSVYDRAIGRGLNGRVHDLSCIRRAPKSGRYLARSAEKDDAALVKRFFAEKSLPLFITHDALCHADFFFDAFPKVRMIEILRDPVSLTESWRKRGWGRRFGVDPKSMDHAFAGPSGPIPWYAVGWKRDYRSYGELDRIVRCLATAIGMEKRQYLALPARLKARIVFTSFEELCVDPRPAVKRLSAFLGAAPLKELAGVLRRERLPRPVDEGARAALLKRLSRGISREGRTLLNQLAADYDSFWLPLTRNRGGAR